MRLNFWKKKPDPPALDIEALAKKAAADPTPGKPIIVEGNFSAADIARLSAAVEAEVAARVEEAKRAEAAEPSPVAPPKSANLPRQPVRMSRQQSRERNRKVQVRPRPTQGRGPAR